MRKIYETMFVSIIVNILLIIVKLITGLLFNSKAVLADGMHSLSDLSTDVVAIVGQKLSGHEADKKHPYGHGRIEYITCIVVGLVILFLALEMIFNTMNTKTEVPALSIIYVVIFTIVSKYILARFITQNGKKYRNCILLASGKESMADVYSSVGVLVLMILANFSEYVDVFKYADKLGGIVISFFIIKTAFNILRDNVSSILGEMEQDETIINDAKAIVKDVDGVEEVEHIELLKYGSYYKAAVIVSASDNKTLQEAHDIDHYIEKALTKSKKINIKYVTVHINPYHKEEQKN